MTGTPIQNDLGELWTMVDFVNPGLLDTYAVFKKTFEQPIVRARQPGATRKVVELGRGRSVALSEITKMFVLRRTSEILTTYLPSKCAPSLFSVLGAFEADDRRVCGILRADGIAATGVQGTSGESGSPQLFVSRGYQCPSQSNHDHAKNLQRNDPHQIQSSFCITHRPCFPTANTVDNG